MPDEMSELQQAMAMAQLEQQQEEANRVDPLLEQAKRELTERFIAGFANEDLLPPENMLDVPNRVLFPVFEESKGGEDVGGGLGLLGGIGGLGGGLGGEVAGVGESLLGGELGGAGGSVMGEPGDLAGLDAPVGMGGLGDEIADEVEDVEEGRVL